MFDIYFQSGEFVGDNPGFWDFAKDLTVQVLSSVVAALTALSLYYKQKKDQRIREDQNRREQESTKLRYLTYLLLESKRFTDHLILHVEHCVSMMEQNPLLIDGMSISPEFNLTRLVEELNHEEYYLSYVTRFAGRDAEISFLFGATDTAKKVNDLISEAWDENYANNKQKGRDIQDAQKSLTHELRYLQNNDLLPGGVVLDIVNLTKDFAEKSRKEKGGYRMAADHLFLPIADYLDRDENQKYRSHTTKLYNTCSEAYLLVDRLSFDNTHFRYQLVVHLDVLRKVQESIDANIQTLTQEFPFIKVGPKQV